MVFDEKEYRKKYYLENKEIILKKMKEYSQKPEVKKRKKEYDKEYLQRPEVKKRYEKNKEGSRKKAKIYHLENKERISKYKKEHNQKPEVRERRKEYLLKNKENYNKNMKKWRIENKDKINTNRKLRIKTDNSFRISCLLRSYSLNSFKRYSTTGKVYSSKKYGIDFTAIIKHLEPFPKDTENYHIDHIIPLSRFDFNNVKHIKIAFAPENHQWLTIKENMEKGNKLIMPH